MEAQLSSSVFNEETRYDTKTYFNTLKTNEDKRALECCLRSHHPGQWLGLTWDVRVPERTTAGPYCVDRPSKLGCLFSMSSNLNSSSGRLGQAVWII